MGTNTIVLDMSCQITRVEVIPNYLHCSCYTHTAICFGAPINASCAPALKAGLGKSVPE